MDHPILIRFLASPEYQTGQVYRTRVAKSLAVDFMEQVYQLHTKSRVCPTFWNHVKEEDLIDLNITTSMTNNCTKLIVAGEFNRGDSILIRRTLWDHVFGPTII